MTVDNGRPMVVNAARGLGVRIAGGQYDDIPVQANGNVAPETGGMSVAPAWRDLPDVRIPHRLREKGALLARGKDSDACWRMGEGAFVADDVAHGLALRPDRPDHGAVEPTAEVSLIEYLNDLAATRDMWVIDED
jgi:hypothetical protein